jgi:hypothetical protein
LPASGSQLGAIFDGIGNSINSLIVPPVGPMRAKIFILEFNLIFDGIGV